MRCVCLLLAASIASASQKTILWSRPASAAVGTPNPGKAGHVMAVNSTHAIAAAGMGAIGDQDMPSHTADVLELSTLKWTSANIQLPGNTTIADDHAGKAPTPPSVGYTFVIGGAKTMMAPNTRVVSDIVPIDQTLAFDTQDLKFKPVTIVKGQENAPGAVRGAATVYLFNAEDRTKADGSRDPRPAVVVYGGLDAAGSATSSTRVLYLGTGNTPDITMGEWVSPGALNLKGNSPPKVSYAAMAASAYGNGAVAMGGYDETGAVTATTYVLTSEIPPPSGPQPEGEEPASTIPTLDVAKGLTPKVSSRQTFAHLMTDTSTSYWFSNREDNPYILFDMSAPVTVTKFVLQVTFTSSFYAADRKMISEAKFHVTSANKITDLWKTGQTTFNCTNNWDPTENTRDMEVECPEGATGRYALMYVPGLAKRIFFVADFKIITELNWRWTAVPEVESLPPSQLQGLSSYSSVYNTRGVDGDLNTFVFAYSFSRATMTYRVTLPSEKAVAAVDMRLHNGCTSTFCKNSWREGKVYVTNEQTFARVDKKASICNIPPFSQWFPNGAMNTEIDCGGLKGKYVFFTTDATSYTSSQTYMYLGEAYIKVKRSGFPTPRAMAAATQFRGLAFFYGGIGNQGTAIDELSIFDTRSNLFLGASALRAIGTPPSGRSRVSFVQLDDRRIGFFGGLDFSGTRTRDFWTLLFDDCTALPTQRYIAGKEDYFGVAYYNCDAGTTAANGNDPVLCGVDGRLSGSVPVCVGARPTMPLNVKVEPGSKELSVKVSWDAPAEYASSESKRAELESFFLRPQVSSEFEELFRGNSSSAADALSSLQKRGWSLRNDPNKAVSFKLSPASGSMTTSQITGCSMTTSSIGSGCPILLWDQARSVAFTEGVSITWKYTNSFLKSNSLPDQNTWIGIWLRGDPSSVKSNTFDLAFGAPRTYDQTFGWSTTSYTYGYTQPFMLGKVASGSSPARLGSGLSLSYSFYRYFRNGYEYIQYSDFDAEWSFFCDLSLASTTPTFSCQYEVAYHRRFRYCYNSGCTSSSSWLGPYVYTYTRRQLANVGIASYIPEQEMNPIFGIITANPLSTPATLTKMSLEAAADSCAATIAPYPAVYSPVNKTFTSYSMEVGNVPRGLNISYKVVAANDMGYGAESDPSPASLPKPGPPIQATGVKLPTTDWQISTTPATTYTWFRPQFLIDGSSSSATNYWSRPPSYPTYLTIDMGSSQVVTDIEVWAGYFLYLRSSEWAISENASPIATKTLCQAPATWLSSDSYNKKMMPCNDARGRYMHATLKYSTSSYVYWNIWDIAVFAKPSPENCPLRPTRASGVAIPDYMSASTDCTTGKPGSVCLLGCQTASQKLYYPISGAAGATCVKGAWDAPELVCGNYCPPLPAPSGLRKCTETLLRRTFMNADGNNDAHLRKGDWMYFESTQITRALPAYWIIQGNRLTTNGLSSGKCADAVGISVIFPDTDLANSRRSMTLRARFQTEGDAGVLFRWRDDKNFMSATLDIPEQSWTVTSVVAGTTIVVASGKVRYELDGFADHVLEVLMEGSSFSLFIDGNLAGTFSQSDLQAGYVGLMSRFRPVSFDLIEVDGDCTGTGCTKGSLEDTCSFQCAPGYTQVGPAVVTCQGTYPTSAAWSNDDITCKLIPPSVSNYTLAVPENSAKDTEIGPEVVTAVIEAADQQIAYGVDSVYRVTASGSLEKMSAYEQRIFNIDVCSGQMSVNLPVLNYEMQNVYVVTVRAYVASDPGVFSVSFVTINILDVNEAPVVSAQSLFINEIPEGPTRIYGASSNSRNDTDGTFMPAGVAIVDPEGDAVRFEIVPSSNMLVDSLFVIDSATGAISTKMPNATEMAMRGQMDFEEVSTYVLNVRVVETSTPEALEGLGQVTIMAIDQNDFPDVRTSADPDAAWGQSLVVVSIKDTAVELTPSAWTSALFSPSLTIVDEDATNGTFGIKPMVVTVDTNLVGLDVTAMLQRFKAGTDDDLAAALFANAANTTLWYPTTDGTQSASAIFRVDAATNSIGFSADPMPGADGSATGKFSKRQQFFFRGKLARQAYAVPVSVNDQYGGTVVIPVVAVVEGDPATNPYVDDIVNASLPLPTAGGRTQVFKGKNIAAGAGVKGKLGRLNPADTSKTEIIPVTSCTASLNEITCTTPAGSGTEWLWELEVEIIPGSGNYESVTFLTLSPIRFEAPVVTAITGNTNVRTRGSQSITLTGTNLGPSNRPRSFRYGCRLRDDEGAAYASPVCKFGCRPSTSTAHTGFRCFTDPSAGANLDWVLDIDGQLVTSDGRPDDVISHAAPTIRPNTGSLAQYILGVTTPSQRGLRDQNTDGYTIGTLDTAGGQDILINGDNFGPPGTSIEVHFGGPSATIGMLENCRQAAGAASHTTLTCRTIPYAGTMHALRVSVAGVDQVDTTNSTTQGLSYLPPIISEVSGPGAFGSPTPGGGNVFITGQHFGPVQFSDDLVNSVYYGPPGNKNRFRAVSCRVVSEPPVASQIICQTAPGTGRNHSWTVAVGGQTTDAFAAGTYYAAPIIASFSGPGAVDADTDGGEKVVISGSNFGPGGAEYPFRAAGMFEAVYTAKLDEFAPVADTPVPEFSFVPSACTILTHEMIECTLNDGVGDRLAWNIVIDGQASTEPVTDYGLPAITSLRVHQTSSSLSPLISDIQTCDPDGGQYVEVRGVNFGPASVNFPAGRGDFLQSVRYGPTGREYTPKFGLVGRGHTRLYFITEPGSGSNLKVSVRVGDQDSGPSAQTFGYAPPEVLSVTPSAGPTYSNPQNPTVVSLEVKNAPLFDVLSDLVVIFGNKDFQAVFRPRAPKPLANGNTEIEFDLPKDGGGVDIPVRVGTIPAKAPVSALRLDQAGGGPGVSASTTESMFSYNDPVVTRAVNIRPFFRISNNASACEDALFNSPFTAQPPASRSVFDCNDQGIRQIELNGENFGADPSELDRPDGLERFLEVNVPDPVTSQPNWVTLPVVVYSWTHNKIVFFSTLSVATVRVRLVSQGFDVLAGTYATREQTVQATYEKSNPDFGALQGGDNVDLTAVPTTGGAESKDEAILIDVTDLDSSTPVIVFIGGVPSTLLDPDTGAALPKPPMDPTDRTSAQWLVYEAAVKNQILLKPQQRPDPSGQGQQTYWPIYVVIPPGQGAAVEVYLFKGTLSSKSLTFSYAKPVISEFSVVDKAGKESARQKPAIDVARIPTDGSSKIRVYGTNLGPCPAARINFFDSMYPADSYTAGPATVDCSVYQESARPGTKGKVVACPGTEGQHTCYEFETYEGEGDGTKIGLAAGFTIELIAEGETEGDGGFVSTPSNFRLAYQPAKATSVTALTSGGFPTEGGARIRINGTNFGKYPTAAAFTTQQDVTILFGTSETGFNLMCTDVVREGHTSATCTIPEGSGRNLLAQMTVASTVGISDGPVLSYSPPVVNSMEIRDASGKVTAAVNASSSPSSPFVIGGSTKGGYTLILYGSNFGAMSKYYHCTFLSWSSRDQSLPFSCGLTDSERETDAWVGQGKISASAVTVHTHRAIEVTVPEGMGAKDIVVYVRGNMLTAAGGVTPRFVYDVPTITAPLEPRAAPTVGGQVITITGANFGPMPRYTNSTTNIPLAIAPAVPVYYMRVTVKYPGCVNSESISCPCITNAKRITGDGRPSRVDGCVIDTALSHTHDMVKFSAPPGIGVDREIAVEFLDAAPSLAVETAFLPAADFRTPSPALFSYSPPVIDLTNPTTVRMHGVSSNADAEPNVRAVDLIGRNFGNFELADAQGWTAEERVLQASMANSPCSQVTRRREGGETVIRCDMMPTFVGYKNISLRVAGQFGFRDVVPRTRALHAVCDNDWFGQPGDVCLPCPQGADCKGYVQEVGLPPEEATANPEKNEMMKHTMPVPRPGWFNLNSSDSLVPTDMSSACPPNFVIQGRDVCVAPCSPASSCIGENYCAVGYRSAAPEYRCSSCALGYYRRAGLCARCPDSPELLIIAFVVMALFAAVAAYFLNKSNIDVALVQIGIDYFQVLAIFASARIKWPAIIQDIFHLMSAFNLNLEITAPECLVPDIAFVTKWLIIMAIPLGCAAMLGLAWVGGIIYNRSSRGGSWKEINAHAGRIVAGYMVMLYFLYLYISKQILDIFNCAPTDPPDGKIYLQAVFEPCDKPGGVHETLLGPAIVALAVYTIGFPLFCLYITCTKKRRETIMLDQLLRCYGVGSTLGAKSCPPQERAFEFRKSYNRLYYAFRPEFFYWILVLLARKFLIALASLMFADAADFQMAFVLLVLFVSYTLQVYFRPYLSRDEFKKVAQEWKTTADASKRDPAQRSLHYEIQSDFDEVVRFSTDLERALNADKSRGAGASLASAASAGRGNMSAMDVLGSSLKNLMNYNTVSTFLLASAILVCLAGIMFESGRLDREGAEASRDAVTGVALTVIFVTLLYFIAVFAGEMLLVCNARMCVRAAGPSGKGGKGKAAGSGSGHGEGDDGEDLLDKAGNVAVKATTTNPMMRSSAAGDDDADGSAALKAAEDAFRLDMRMLGDKPPTSEEAWREFKTRFEEQARQVHSLNDTLASLRREKASGAAVVSSFAMRGSKKALSGRRGSFKTVKAGGSSRRKSNVMLKSPKSAGAATQ